MNSDRVMVYFLMFFTYVIVGWVWESIYMSVIEKRIQNRGFLHGPYIPIYGCVGMAVYFTMGRMQGDLFSINSVYIYFIGMFAATIAELITATAAEKILGHPLWDYTIYKINYKGKIALIASLFWGLMALLFVQVFNPAIISFVSSFSHDTKVVVVTLMSTLMGADLIITSIGHSKLPKWWNERYTVVNGKWENFMNKITRDKAA